MTPDSDDRRSGSRRSFMKNGALGSGILAFGIGGIGSVAAQDTEGESDQSGGREALAFNDQFRPGALFRAKASVSEARPDIESTGGSSLWSEYDAWRIEYLNTDEEVFFFPASDAEIQSGGLYRFRTGFTPARGVADPSLVSVEYESFPEVTDGDETQLLPGEDLEIIDGGGNALVMVNNFHPGALILVTSGIYERAPEEGALEGAEQYNTRLVEYLNTGEDFFVFPDDDADVVEGAVYLVRENFERFDAGGSLIEIELSRVDQDDVPDDYM